MKVKFSQAIINEYNERLLNHSPFGKITSAGTYDLIAVDVKKIAEDCRYQANMDEDGVSISSGATRAYRSLYKQVSNGR